MDIIEKLKARKAVIHIRFGQQQHGILISEAERDALLALVEPQWQPMETAKERCANGEPYLVYHHDWGMSVQWFAIKGTYAGFNWRADENVPEPTHWMPLPAPPSPRPSPSSETPETRA